MRLHCEDCDWTGTDDEANPAQDITERHSIGCIYSDMECPKCGALCYPIKATESFPWAPYVPCKDNAELMVRRAAPELLSALEAMHTQMTHFADAWERAGVADMYEEVVSNAEKAIALTKKGA